MHSLLQQYDFGPHKINESEVFAKTPFSIAFVNLKPVVPGHVLVSPRRVAKRLQDLDQNELADLWVRRRGGSGWRRKQIETSLTALGCR